MAKTVFSSFLVLSLLLQLVSLHCFVFVQASSNPDLEALMAFKASSDTSNKLTSWSNGTNPCTSTWYGVSCAQTRVSHLVLEGLQLEGGIESLASLNQLRLLSLKNNSLSGPIPDLTSFTKLKLLFLSYNGFSGEFPPSVPSLVNLFRLDLSHNNLSGHIPAKINRLTHLITLRLEENQFSGSIEDLNVPNLQDFNVSRNQLTGEIPKTLSSFPETSFVGNLVMCGSPLPSCKDVVSDPSNPRSDGSGASSPVGSVNGGGGGPSIVSSSPSSKPVVSSQTAEERSNSRHGSKLSLFAVVAIIVGDVLVLALISGLLFWYFWRNVAGKLKDGKGSQILEGEKIIYSSSPYPNSQLGSEKGKMNFFEGNERRFELEDLLRASAEMLGKGGFGTAYKAVLDDGSVVAVKRLKETTQFVAKRDFEQRMEVLGHLRHPNIVSLKAYYYGKDEKLLVYEYMPNSSLFWLLHGNRGPGRTPLDWTTRLKIAAGAARGLAFIHQSGRTVKLTHGNIKSTNVLLDSIGNARVSDFGLSAFVSPTANSNDNQRLDGYNAPETLADSRKFSQKSDVYSFGVLLLEILTGKCPFGVENVGGQPGNGGAGVVDLPRWVQSVVREEWTAEVFDLELMRYKDIEEEMVELLQVAVACTAAGPDQRPTLRDVLQMIVEIRGGAEDESTLFHDESFDPVSDSPSVIDSSIR